MVLLRTLSNDRQDSPLDLDTARWDEACPASAVLGLQPDVPILEVDPAQDSADAVQQAHGHQVTVGGGGGPLQQNYVASVYQGIAQRIVFGVQGVDPWRLTNNGVGEGDEVL
jgi:hypothetical protein